MKKKICSLLLAGLMLTSVLPAGAFAADADGGPVALDQSEQVSVWDGSVDSDGLAANTNGEDKTVSIASAAQLAALAQSVNSGTSYAAYTISLDTDINLANREWTPIGGTDTGKTFSGTFDGAGHTISNLKITRGLDNVAANNRVGLFGAGVGSAKIQNFTLHNVDVQGCLNVAAVLGGSGVAEAKVAHVQVTGSVRVYGWWYVGGIMGKGYTTITNCSVEGDGVSTSSVAITGGYAGGIVGFMGQGNCVTTGCTVKDLTVSGAYNGIGGINGILHYGNTIENSTAENVVVWQTDEPSESGRIYCGAFAGTYLDNDGKNPPALKNCTFTGKLYSGADKTDVTEANRYVGSLWYGAEPPATVNIENCTVESKTQVVPVQGVSLNQTVLVLEPDETVQLTATVTPADATQQALIWESSDAAVATVENGLVTAAGAGTATITVKVNAQDTDFGFASDTCAVTVSKKPAEEQPDDNPSDDDTKPDDTPSGDSNGAGGSSGGSSSGSSSGNKTETTTHPDGSTTTTVTKPDGSITETTKKPDGSQQVVETGKDGTTTTTTTDADGNKTATTAKPDGSSITTVTQTSGATSITTVDGSGKQETGVKLPQAVVDAAADKGETVVLPMQGIAAATDKTTAPSVTVSLSGGASAKVEVPVADVTMGTVAVLVKPDGTEGIVKNTIVTENGVALMVGDGETIKIVDNTKSFDDVTDAHWGNDAVTFAASRELMSGTGTATFTPEGDMTRAMILTVLARYKGVDTAVGANWYDAGRDWAVENGISDGGNLDASVTREQLAAMLYRYVGSPAVTGTVEGFADADQISGWASDAMRWATQTGLLSGKAGSMLDPTGTATRAQVAQILMNFCQNIA